MPTLSAVPTIEEHAPRDMIVDERVQRALSEARIGQILADLRLHAIGVPTLSRRANGDLHIIDGQHRMAAMTRSGLAATSVKCEVYEDLSPADEAREFLLRNDRYLVNIIDRFRIGVLSGDAECVKIDNIVTHHGFRVAQGENAVLCVAELRRIYRGGKTRKGEPNPAAVDATMSIIAQAWGTEHSAIRETVAGVGGVIAEYNGGVDHGRLVLKLARLSGGPAGLAGRAKTLRQIGKASSIAEGAKQAVIDLYNEGLRKAGKLGD